MANFNKTIEECKSETDKMLYLLKNIGKMATQPTWLQQEVYSRIFKACEIAEFSEDKRIQYEKDMYDEKRLNGEMSAARRIGYENGHKEGLKNGHEEGLKQGLEQGRRQGLEQGLEQGREQAKIEMAKNLKALGVSLDIISQSTGIGIDVIEKL
jgi:predicted transposase/invertase (TIGR01784 family)